MRYGCGLLLLWAPTLAAFCRPLLFVVYGGRGRASHWRKPQRGKEQQHLFRCQHQNFHCHQKHQGYQHNQHRSGKNCVEENWRKKAMSMARLPPAASPWALPGWFSHPSPLCRLKSRWYGSNLEPVFSELLIAMVLYPKTIYVHQCNGIWRDEHWALTDNKPAGLCKALSIKTQIKLSYEWI